MKIPGTLSQVSEGVWVHRLFQSKVLPDGTKRISRPQRTLYVKNEQDLMLQAMKFVQECGVTTDSQGGPETQLKDALLLWITEESSRTPQKTSFKQSQPRVAGFVDWVGPKSLLSDVTPHHVARYWKWRMATSGIKASTASREVSALTGFFKFCIETELLSKNPCRDAVKPKVERNLEVPVCDRKEIEEVLEKTQGHPTFYPFYLFSWFQAWRKKTVLDARWENIEPGPNGTLCIKVKTKVGWQRFLLSHRVTRWVQENRKESGPIVLGPKGEALSGSGFDSLRVRSDLELPCTHACRRGWANDAFRNGASIEELRVALGHKDQKQTADYLHLDEGLFATALLRN